MTQLLLNLLITVAGLTVLIGGFGIGILGIVVGLKDGELGAFAIGVVILIFMLAMTFVGYHAHDHPCLKIHRVTAHHDAMTWYQDPRTGGLSLVYTGTNYIPITFSAYDAQEEVCDQRK
jgi:hypothetical protein